MNCINNMPKEWAADQARTEAEAFETAIKRIKNDFKVDEEVEQAYRYGWHDGFKCCNKKMLGKVIQENAELRDALKIQSEEIQRLREYIARNEEEYYE